MSLALSAKRQELWSAGILVCSEMKLQIESRITTRPLFAIGGADVARQLLEAGKLDVVVLTTTPDVLEDGLKLWAADSWREGFELVAREEFASGLSQEIWRLKN